MRRMLGGYAVLALLAGCGETADNGALSADESRRLDAAAKMLDEGNAAATDGNEAGGSTD